MEILKFEIDKKIEKEEKRKSRSRNQFLPIKSPPINKAMSGTLPNLKKIFGRPIFGKNRISSSTWGLNLVENQNLKKSQISILPENHNSIHTPIIRRDLPPEMPKLRPKMKQMSRSGHYPIMKRSVSEMHLPRNTNSKNSKNFGEKIEKLDTDSDTGFSSLDSFDGESRDLETLV